MKSLTKAEELIMEAIWKIKSGFLKDVIEALPDPRPHANTVATIVKILVEKKYVTFETQGRNNLYKMAIKREEYVKRSMTRLMKGFFEGSPINVVSHLIKHNEMTLKQLEDLLKQIKSSK